MTGERGACPAVFIGVLAIVVSVASVSAPAQPVALDVAFTLTDLEYHALPGVPVRLVFGSDSDWQAPGAGTRFVTDAKGEANFTANVTLDARQRKYPTNFWSSLGSLPQRTDHVMVAAELDFAGFHWLYAADLYRFPNGDTMTDGLGVRTADAKGRFAYMADYDGKGWKMRDLNGLMLTHPGYELGDFGLAPDPADPAKKHWTLKIAFRKSPPPVRR